MSNDTQKQSKTVFLLSSVYNAFSYSYSLIGSFVNKIPQLAGIALCSFAFNNRSTLADDISKAISSNNVWDNINYTSIALYVALDMLFLSTIDKLAGGLSSISKKQKGFTWYPFKHTWDSANYDVKKEAYSTVYKDKPEKVKEYIEALNDEKNSPEKVVEYLYLPAVTKFVINFTPLAIGLNFLFSASYAAALFPMLSLLYFTNQISIVLTKGVREVDQPKIMQPINYFNKKAASLIKISFKLPYKICKGLYNKFLSSKNNNTDDAQKNTEHNENNDNKGFVRKLKDSLQEWFVEDLNSYLSELLEPVKGVFYCWNLSGTIKKFQEQRKQEEQKAQQDKTDREKQRQIKEEREMEKKIVSKLKKEMLIKKVLDEERKTKLENKRLKKMLKKQIIEKQQADKDKKQEELKKKTDQESKNKNANLDTETVLNDKKSTTDKKVSIFGWIKDLFSLNKNTASKSNVQIDDLLNSDDSSVYNTDKLEQGGGLKNMGDVTLETSMEG